MDNAKRDWDSAQFFSHNTGSSHPTAPFISHELSISAKFVAALTLFISAMLYYDLFHQSNDVLEEQNVYLQHLKKQEAEKEKK